MPKRIYAIRHGQAQHNVNPHLELWLNPEFKFSALTPLGVEQAIKASETKPEVDVIYVSPLRRTLQTATHMFGPVPMICLPELREVNLDHIVNTHEDQADLELQHPHVDFSAIDFIDVGRYRHDHDVKLDNLLAILRDSPFKRIALVSHNDLLVSLFERVGVDITQLEHAHPYTFTIEDK